jgi:hypothetical protein
MREVKIVNTATGQEFVLPNEQRNAFRREFRRTHPWRSFHTLLDFLQGKDRYVPPRIAADAEVFVTYTNGRTRQYRIYGRAVLHDVATGRNRQFYMGILLLESVS